jgi:hypothetical protein
MSFRLSSLRIGFGLLAVAASSLLLCSAQGGGKERGRSIDFSEPKSDEITTNLHQLTSKKDSLKQLEEDLYQPLQAFTPKSSLEGVVAPLPRPPAVSAIQNKRVKELLERRKNWVFMTPEDLLSGPTVEEILKSPQYEKNGQEKKELPPLERYYQRLSAKRTGRINPSQSTSDDLFGTPKASNSRDQIDSGDDANLPSGLRESALALKQLAAPDTSGDPFALSAPRNSFSDTFGLDGNALPKEEVLAHKKYMDEYRSLVDPGWQRPDAANPVNPLPNLANTARPTGNPAAGLGGLPSPAAHKGLEAQLDITHPLLGPPGLPDVNAQALGQPRSAPDLPTVESPKMVAPTFTAPKRTF